RCRGNSGVARFPPSNEDDRRTCNPRPKTAQCSCLSHGSGSLAHLVRAARCAPHVEGENDAAESPKQGGATYKSPSSASTSTLPLAFLAMRYDRMNGSRSPSNTRSTSPTSNFVRWSLIRRYGCITYDRIWLPKEISSLVSSSLSVSCCLFCISRSYSLDRNIFIASSRFLPWLRSTWQATTTPVGRWVMRAAVSTLLTFCPPLPPERNVSTLMSSGLMLISMRSSISGITNTDANEVCRRAAWSKGEILTSRCTPVSPASNP